MGGIIEKTLDMSSFNTKLNISFDVSEESRASIIGAISTIETYGIAFFNKQCFIISKKIM